MSPTFFANTEEFRKWLEENHQTEKELIDFEVQAPSYKKNIIYWVMSAKQEATRISRLNKLIDACSEGKRLI
ncbi:MAG: YdeI/OmpD-associated family protein [Bacteroidota bacterium]|nr:YdeI/OmpD-associated family protein [Bacteroidota bacterium]